MPENKVVLITGVSSGIGQATTRLLAQRGYTVFGTIRDPLRVEKVAGAELLALDVRVDESVKACVEAVLTRAERLDVLVNNAGYVLRCAVEEAALEEARAQFETNFFGVVRMVKAALPVMRRQGGGQIINISSLVGLVPLPFGGFYSASKFALEGYTEALRHEVKPFNIRVSLVEPGFVKTRLAENTQSPAQRIPDYDPWRQRVLEVRRRYAEKAPEPALVAERVLSIIKSGSPRLRYMVGREARVTRLRRFLPESLFEWGMRRRLHLDERGAA
jgi:NAD(P)-dependent dehydrogenase (short-subunit alcohol dehydrogenase family)